MIFLTKEDAFAMFEDTRADWLAKARTHARAMAAKGPVTVDDVRAVCPPPSNTDPRVMGALFKKDEWEPCGWVESTRRECHHRPIRTFKLRG